MSRLTIWHAPALTGLDSPHPRHEEPSSLLSARVRARNAIATALVLIVAALIWFPRQAGPIDMRWDGGVYYVLGTSIAEGKGYRLLNEPGEIAADQYPPLLPAVVAVHQRLLGTSDPTVVGRVLRTTAFLVFLTYAVIVLRFFSDYVSTELALLGTMLALFCLHAWFMSDTLFPDVWFGAATLLFLVLIRRRQTVVGSGLTYLAALASYGLRTIGVAAFAVWVLQSLVRRRYREAVVRAVLVLVPVAGWQLYVTSVEHSRAYIHPAYEYQRAPYQFYNVSYARNIALRDPFTPEKGQVRIVRRVVRNLLDIPVNIGETLTGKRNYFETALHGLFGDGPVVRPIIDWVVFVALSIVGVVLVAGGAVVLLRDRDWIVPVYLAAYIGAICLTPFPAQFLRYLMPVAALLGLCGLMLLRRLGPRWPLLLVPALLIEALVFTSVQRHDYRPISYVDAAGRLASYQLFFYDDHYRGFDEAIDYLRAHAERASIVAAPLPQWVYLRTGLKAVMPPLERNVANAERLLEAVPVNYLIVGEDVIGSERYTVPVVSAFRARWETAYATPTGGWTIYRRVDTHPAAFQSIAVSDR
jgi:hypothetical protein